MQIREIENHLMECPNVREVCVMPYPDNVGKMRFHAFVVLGKGTPLALEEFKAHCKVRLKNSDSVMKLQIMERLPKTPVGTVSRSVLANLAFSNP